MYFSKQLTILHGAMIYLKCNNCGHLNELRSENLFFCIGCNKPLTNSFSEWKKANPAGTFEEYKNKVCIIDEQPKVAQPKRSSRRNTIVMFSVILVVAGGLLFTGFYFIEKYAGDINPNSLINWFKSEKTSKDVLTQKWMVSTYDNPGITLSTPEKLTQMNLNAVIPQQIKSMIERMDTYGNEDSKGVKVVINFTKFNDNVPDLNLRNGVDGSINAIRNTGATDFNYKEQEVTQDEIPGIKQDGTYIKDGVEVKYYLAMYVQKPYSWQVVIICQKDDEVGIAVGKRVFESISFKGTTL